MQSVRVLITVYNLTSSANRWHVTLLSNILARLLTYSKNRKGPMQLPWMTPLIILTGSDIRLPTRVHCHRPVRKCTNHCSKLPENPVLSSLQNNLFWQTESKAFWKSIYATATDDLFIKAHVQSFIELSILILVTVDFLARNPCCCLLIKPCSLQ